MKGLSFTRGGKKKKTRSQDPGNFSDTLWEPRWFTLDETKSKTWLREESRTRSRTVHSLEFPLRQHQRLEWPRSLWLPRLGPSAKWKAGFLAQKLWRILRQQKHSIEASRSTGPAECGVLGDCTGLAREAGPGQRSWWNESVLTSSRTYRPDFWFSPRLLAKNSLHEKEERQVVTKLTTSSCPPLDFAAE